MDGLVPDVSGGSMQSATVGSLLGQLSVEERLAVVVGLLKYIEPQPSQQASKAMSIVEALMADKPSTELVALMGPSDASRWVSSRFTRWHTLIAPRIPCVGYSR